MSFSSVAGGNVKAQLRELYKKVHPDLFQNHEQARDANEKSFKLLQVGFSAAISGLDRIV